MKSHRLFNMYFITTISVALVLFLVGLECLVVLSAHELMRHVKENVVVSVVMTDECSADQRGRLERILDASPYCLDYHYISREQALQEHIENLGEDPQHFLGYNPLFDSYEVHLHAPYAQSDSIAQIEEGLLSLPYISKVVYQRDVLEVLDKNLNDVGVILSLVAIALLVIALSEFLNNSINSSFFATKSVSALTSTTQPKPSHFTTVTRPDAATRPAFEAAFTIPF